MTTIALHFDGGVGTVAADGRETDTDGHICSDRVTKIMHTDVGDVLACCGDVGVIEVAIRHWGKEGYADALTECLGNDMGMSCLYYDPELGTWNMYGVGRNAEGKTYEYQQVIDYNFAIGNGAQFAIAAMDFGCDAVGAIEYAATRDSCTGGRIEQWSPATALTEPVDGTTLPDHMG